MKRILVALALAIVVSAPASAAPFTWVVAGQITHEVDSAGLYDTYLHVGDAFTWTLQMESSAPDYDPRSSCGVFKPITTMAFASGGLSLSTSPAGQDFVVSLGGPLDLCYVPSGYTLVRSNFGSLFIQMHILSPPLTDALPLIPPSPSTVTVDFYYGAPPFVMRNGTATITAVPEPAASGLLVVGLVSGVRRLRASTRSRRGPV